jgi:signal transduction histidine kinase
VQLQQVILNLALNAADAVADVEGEREIVIRTLSDGDSVRMCVADNGRGIPPEQLDAMFNPFWTTKPGGMGMGLAICRSIAAAHHGTIEASNNPGRGATFCLSLPAAKPA